MLAGMAAAAVVSAILPGPLNVSTTLGNGVTATMGVFLEMFLTSLLVFTIFMLAAEKHKATFLAPIGIGLALFVAEMVGVFFTGGSLNPARSFGPCVVTREFPSYHYIYWFGPLMGTLLAFGMYRIVTLVEYQTVNPGQDFDDHEAALFQPPEDAETADQVERPNVAAIAMQEAMRTTNQASSGSISEKKVEEVGADGRLGSAHTEHTVDQRPVSDQELLERTGHAHS
jgi:aquaporin related protein